MTTNYAECYNVAQCVIISNYFKVPYTIWRIHIKSIYSSDSILMLMVWYLLKASSVQGPIYTSCWFIICSSCQTFHSLFIHIWMFMWFIAKYRNSLCPIKRRIDQPVGSHSFYVWNSPSATFYLEFSLTVLLLWPAHLVYYGLQHYTQHTATFDGPRYRGLILIV